MPQLQPSYYLATLVPCGMALLLFYLNRKRRCKRGYKKSDTIAQNLIDLIGNTPLLRLRSLSEATGCEVLAKAEFLNPGGSTKDRIALRIIEDAERDGRLMRSGTIYEGSAGSTGISLALVARIKGYRCKVYMSDDQAREKRQLLASLGCDVRLVKPVGIADPNHFYNVAKREAAADPEGFFSDQFENISNFEAHYSTTGPEIYEQTDGMIDAFVMSAGTGGTIAGVSAYLKTKDPLIKVFLADPPGSGLYNKVTRGVCFAAQEKEGTRRRHQVDSIIEGVGINRLTRNFLLAQLDGAFRVTDAEAVLMGRMLMSEEGLFVGGSSALNCVAAYRVAKLLGPGHTIVTTLSDAGSRYLTRFWDDEFVKSCGLMDDGPVEGLHVFDS